MNTVTVSEVRNNLDTFIERVLTESEPTFIRSADGQQTVLLPRSKYEALLQATHSPNNTTSPILSTTPRVLGLDIGSVWMSDDFDDPLPDEFWLGDEEKIS